MGVTAARLVSVLRPWQTLHSELVLDEPWYRVRRDMVRLPDGRIVDDYFATVRSDVAGVCAVTPAGGVVLVRQWKQGIRSFMLELPGGVCDEGEEPAATAARELLEETGYACRELRPLGAFEPDPSKASYRVHLFLGLGAERVAEPLPDPQEEIEVELRPLAAARAAIATGEITALSTVAGLQRATDELGTTI